MDARSLASRSSHSARIQSFTARAIAADMSRLKGNCTGKSGLRMPAAAPQRSSAWAWSCATPEGGCPFGPRQSARQFDGAFGGKDALSRDSIPRSRSVWRQYSSM